MYRFIPIGILVVSLSCSPRSVETEIGSLEAALRAAPTLDVAIAQSDSVVVLIYRASECYACDRNVATWIRRRSEGGSVFFYSSSTPIDLERKAALIARVPLEGVLRQESPAAPQAPFGVLVVSGRVAMIFDPRDTRTLAEIKEQQDAAGARSPDTAAVR
jgi:hypothetical protein